MPKRDVFFPNLVSTLKQPLPDYCCDLEVVFFADTAAMSDKNGIFSVSVATLQRSL